ncbi:protein unc-93 homolog B1-like [Cebidichthys violaceus]
MRAKLSILLATLLLACYCYWVMERRLASKVPFRLPRIPRPRHKVKGYRYLEEDNSDESDSEKSEEDDEEHVAEEMGAEDGEEGGRDAGVQGVESPEAGRRGAEGPRHRREDAHVKEGVREEREGG